MATLEELLHGPDGKTIQGFADKRVTDALKTYAANHPSNGELTKRVMQIERTAEARIAQERLNTYFVRAAYKAGIDPEEIESLGVQFADEADIDAKVKTYKERFADHEKKVANNLLASGFKPGSGNAPMPGLTRNQFESMSDEERVMLEKTGRLNELLGSLTKKG